MTDSYLGISKIANDEEILERVNACAVQQHTLGNLPISEDPLSWVSANRYVWASSPGWAEKWDYALETHPDDPEYKPGADDTVITDGDILATVQALGNPS